MCLDMLIASQLHHVYKKKNPMTIISLQCTSDITTGDQ